MWLLVHSAKFVGFALRTGSVGWGHISPRGGMFLVNACIACVILLALQGARRTPGSKDGARKETITGSSAGSWCVPSCAWYSRLSTAGQNGWPACMQVAHLPAIYCTFCQITGPPTGRGTPAALVERTCGKQCVPDAEHCFHP